MSDTTPEVLVLAASNGENLKLAQRFAAQAEAQGLRAAVLCPLGFVCDHVEVLWDLDQEAAAVCRELGIDMARAEAANADPMFIDLMADLVLRTLRRYSHGRPLPLVRPSPHHS